jgi:hypothetical protein
VEFLGTNTVEWADEWTETNQLPKLVKITLGMGPKNFQSSPQNEVVRIIALPSVTVQQNWQTVRTGQQPGPRPGPQ